MRPSCQNVSGDALYYIMSCFTSGLHYLFVFLMIPVEEIPKDPNSGATHDKNEKWMFPSDCKRYPDYETDAKFRKIENNRIAYLSDIRTDRGTEFIGHLDFLSAKPTKPTLFNNSVSTEQSQICLPCDI